MEAFNNDLTPYKKKSNKKKPKKSDHKHQYEAVEIKEWYIQNWFNYKKVCRICGKETNKLVIEKGGHNETSESR